MYNNFPWNSYSSQWWNFMQGGVVMKLFLSSFDQSKALAYEAKLCNAICALGGKWATWEKIVVY